MSRKRGNLPRTCANCANYEQRTVTRKERRQQRRSSGGHVFHSDVQPFQHSAAVVAPAPQVGGPALQPGVHREVEQNRAETWFDSLSHLSRGLVIGVVGCCAAGTLVLIFPSWPLRLVPIFGLGATAFGLTVSVFNPKDVLVAKVKEWLDREDDSGGQAGTVHHVFDGKLDNGRGRQLFLKFTLEGEDAHLCWHRFCKAVAYQDRNFSETEAVKRQGITPDDWLRIYRAFTEQQLLQPAGKRGTPKLINEGPQWVELYADTPPSPDGRGVSGRLYGDR